MKAVRSKVTTKGNGATLQQHVSALSGRKTVESAGRSLDRATKAISDMAAHPATDANAAAKASGEAIPLPEHSKSILRDLFMGRNQAEAQANQAVAIFRQKDANVAAYIGELCAARGLNPKQFAIAPDGGSLVPKPEEGDKKENARAGDLAAKVAESLKRRKKNQTASPSVN